MTLSDDARAAFIASEIERIDRVLPSADGANAKHRKMSRAPYLFMRGSAQLFFSDIASGVLHVPKPFDAKSMQTAILGDCHLSNFGFVTEKGSHGNHIVFVPDDFDEACIAPAAWDLVRFLVSLWLARDQVERVADGSINPEDVDDPAGLEAPDDSDCWKAGQLFLDTYCAVCEEITEHPEERNRVIDAFDKGNILRKYLKKARKRAIGGKKFEEKSSLGKAVAIKGSGLRFRDRPRYKRLDAATMAQIRAKFRPFVDDTILDIVQRLGQGTGSLNMTRYYLLVGPEGASTHAELPMCQIVEVKKQRTSSVVHTFPGLDPRNELNSAHLTVTMQRRLQREPDLLLEDVAWEGDQWLVRSRHHARVSPKIEEVFLAEDDPQDQVFDLCRACGEALALAHSRGDYRTARFEYSMSSAVKESGEALLETAEAYARQVIEDWRIFKALSEPQARRPERGADQGPRVTGSVRPSSPFSVAVQSVERSIIR